MMLMPQLRLNKWLELPAVDFRDFAKREGRSKHIKQIIRSNERLWDSYKKMYGEPCCYDNRLIIDKI